MRVSGKTWKKGDKLELDLPLNARLVVGDQKNQGKAAVLYGPLVLAVDQALADSRDIGSLAMVSPDRSALAINPEPAPERLKPGPARKSSSSMGQIGRRLPQRNCGWCRSPTRGSRERAIRCGYRCSRGSKPVLPGPPYSMTLSRARCCQPNSRNSRPLGAVVLTRHGSLRFPHVAVTVGRVGSRRYILAVDQL